MVPLSESHLGLASASANGGGEVKHQSDSDAAFAAVSRLAGVGGITNEIRVITAGLGG